MSKLSVYDERSFWRAVDAVLGSRTTEDERLVCEKLKMLDQYKSGDAEDRQEAVDEAVRNITLWREHLNKAPQRIDVTPSDDARWGLLADLRARQETSSERWAAVSVTASRDVIAPITAAPEWRTLQIEVDYRLSLRSLKSALERLWPHLRLAGIVRQSRPLTPQKIALVRHVCLDTPSSMTWRQRFVDWNEKYRRRKGWSFFDARAYSTEFHKAERSLTGAWHGLRWYYSPVAQLPISELNELADKGDRAAARERDLRIASGWESIRASGINVVFED